MGTITEFNDWLEQANLEGFEDVYALYSCVLSGSNFGEWVCKKKDGRLFISAGHCDDKLMIASDSAKSLFLEIISRKYCAEKMDMETWYISQKEMVK